MISASMASAAIISEALSRPSEKHASRHSLLMTEFFAQGGFRGCKQAPHARHIARAHRALEPAHGLPPQRRAIFDASRGDIEDEASKLLTQHPGPAVGHQAKVRASEVESPLELANFVIRIERHTRDRPFLRYTGSG